MGSSSGLDTLTGLASKPMPEDDTEYWGWYEIKPKFFHLGTHTGHPGNPMVTAICRAAARELGVGTAGPPGPTIMSKELPAVKGHTVAVWCPNCQRAVKLVHNGNYYGTLLLEGEAQLAREIG